jgi:hypothetical protein
VEDQVSKFEFASPEWLDALQERLAFYTEQAGPDLELSLCEVFTGVPAHLDKHGNGTIAWHCLIKNGQVHFEEVAIDEADVRSETDYEFILPVARRVYSPEVMPEVDAYIATGVADGRMKSTGKDRSKVPASFIQMHNDLAVRTL